MQTMKIALVAGARPNFMKIAPLVEELKGRPWAVPYIIHTGQHYDEIMSTSFFEALGIPRPDVNLDVGSGSHAWQTGEIMKRIEPVLERERPDLVMVVGDVNSTVAASITAVKMGIRVAHVEAGLRSFDRGMPEEINRMVTDSISDLLFTTEPSANENLAREGVGSEKIHFAGNVMIDTLLRQKERAAKSAILEQLGLVPGAFALLTLHRPSNVDDAGSFTSIFAALHRIQQEIPVVFPIHPRTRNRISDLGLLTVLDRLGGNEPWHGLDPRFPEAGSENRGLHFLDPVGYHDFLKMMMEARLVLTDSGGIQEETTCLGVPCVTIRENTERPVTLTRGTNVLAGCNTERIVEAGLGILGGEAPPSAVPELWDGRAAVRIVDVIGRLAGH